MATIIVPANAAGEVKRGWAGRFAEARWIVPAIFAVAIALRLLVILLLPTTPVSDGQFYMERAAEMAAGLGYQEDGHPTAFWPVGYPALLAGSMMVFGPNLVGPLLLNLLAAAATVWLVLWFGRRLAGSEAAARLAALLYALYPAHIVYTGAPFNEVVTTALAMGAFALLVAGRRRMLWLVAAGLLFGIATLMRPQVMLFPAGAIVALLLVYRDFLWRDAAKAALVVHIALFAAVMPWSLRNQQVFGEFVLVSTNGGIALQAGANDLAHGDHFNVYASPLAAEIGIPFEDRVRRQVEMDRRLKDMAWQWIGENPGRWAALGVRKMYLLWHKDSDAFWSVKNGRPHMAGAITAAQWANQLFYTLILALALFPFVVSAGAILRGRDALKPLALLFCMPAFVTILAFAFSGQIRYHFPAMPFLFVAAAWALVRFHGFAIRPRSQ
ncbi:MAG TPA: glycosyltransferase family 39 protein [Allosphingosinicella sp.]|jgi:4-amino-4-deoxy-L-arabinose transferase-like glycosyltransferase